MLPAVLNSPRSMDTLIEAASRTDTSSLPCLRKYSLCVLDHLLFIFLSAVFVDFFGLGSNILRVLPQYGIVFDDLVLHPKHRRRAVRVCLLRVSASKDLNAVAAQKKSARN